MGIRTISAAVAALAVLGGAIALTGCGNSESVSNQRIIHALGLKPLKQGSSYAIGGDPFCQVDGNLLNNEDEISRADDSGGKGLVLTDAHGVVGVVTVPPFDPSCVKKARRALDRID